MMLSCSVGPEVRQVVVIKLNSKENENKDEESNEGCSARVLRPGKRLKADASVMNCLSLTTHE